MSQCYELRQSSMSQRSRSWSSRVVSRTQAAAGVPNTFGVSPENGQTTHVNILTLATSGERSHIDRDEVFQGLAHFQTFDM